MADQVMGPLVTSSGSSFCVIGAPQLRPMSASPDRETRPESEQDESEASRATDRVEVVASKDSEADQDDHDDNDHRPDAQFARPRDAAPLHGEGGREPVQPERPHPTAKISSTARTATEAARGARANGVIGALRSRANAGTVAVGAGPVAVYAKTSSA